jgi:type I restriction enzyme, S subunit
MSVTIGSLIDSKGIEIAIGFPSGQHNQDGVGTPHMRPFNVTVAGSADLRQIKYVQGKIESDRFLLHRGDILFNNTNTEELVGKTAYWPHDGAYAFSNHMTRIRVLDHDSLVPRFLAFALHHHWQTGESQLLCRRHVAQASIIGERFREIAIPSFEQLDQAKISTVLWKIQCVIEVEEKVTAAAREMKQAAMRQLFTRGLRGEAQNETDNGLVPESWAVSNIRANHRIVAGGTPERGNAAYWDGGTIPWVKTGEVDYCVITDTEEKITQSGLENSAAKLVPKGTVLVAMYGQGITRGKAAILGIEAATNQACVGLIPLNDKILPEYLYHYLTYSYERLRTLSHGAQQQNLNAELVGGFPIAYPDPEKDAHEQQDIVRILSAIDSKISTHDRKRRTLRDLFKTLLHQLMTGEIRVADLDIDASEVTA